MLICLCILGLVGPLLAQDQYQQFDGQAFSPGQAFPDQGFPSNQPYPGEPSSAAVPAYAQPLTSTNYKADGHQRLESVDGQGNLKGEYSYVDPNGKTITVKYTAGEEGFQVEGDHLPQAPALSAEPVQPQEYQSHPQQFSQPQYQFPEYQSEQQPAVPQYEPQQYQAQSQYETQVQPQYQTQSQPQYQLQPQQYQTQPEYQAQIQEYQPEPQYHTQYQPEPQYQTQPYQSQPQLQAQPQSQPSLEFPGFPQNRFGNPSVPPGVTLNQNPNGGYTYSYSPVDPQQQ